MSQAESQSPATPVAQHPTKISTQQAATALRQQAAAALRQQALAKPAWLRVHYNEELTTDVNEMMVHGGLHTVCREANCPNLGECYKKYTATFMILGANCTRNCRFCNVRCEKPEPVDPEEPQHLADVAKRLGAKHVVVTSVDRDDLPDGGAGQFVKVIRAVRETVPGASIEVLIPDFRGEDGPIDMVLRELPEVLNHNVETVPDLYRTVQPQANYAHTLHVLARAAAYAKEHKRADGTRMLVKSGMMLGLGENNDQLKALFDDLAAHGCDILSVGQYLQPSPAHYPLQRYVTPEEFAKVQAWAEAAGIAYVIAGPLVRSSYRAVDALRAMEDRLRREAQGEKAVAIAKEGMDGSKA